MISKYQTNGWCFSRPLIGYSNLGLYLLFTSPHCSKFYARVFSSSPREKMRSNYFVLAVHGFGMAKTMIHLRAGEEWQMFDVHLYSPPPR